MRILVDLAEADCRQWLVGFAAHLAAAGQTVRFRVRPGETAADRGIERLLAFEAILFRRDGSPWKPLEPRALAAPEPGFAPDCILALSGEAAGGGASAERRLALMLDGGSGIAGLARLLVAGRVPRLALVDAAGVVRSEGLPAVETTDVLGQAIAHVTARVATLVLMALDGQTRMRLGGGDPAPTRRASGAARFAMRALWNRIGRRLAGPRLKAQHWRVGLRQARAEVTVNGDTLFDGFAWLPDDGKRYYADPILWSEGEREFLFVEEFRYDLGRGVIAYTELGADGKALFAPRTVITRATHLSYPFLFRHDGAIYLAPENAEEGHVPLYRARRFPDEWEEVAPLLPDTGLHDATLFAHAGRFWLMGNEALHGGSSWDCLALFSAPTPLGPFVPHPGNPVLVDARLARPGGPMLAIGGSLVRPVQSCLGGYGRFTRFVVIDELSEATFRQSQRGRLLAPQGGSVAGVHTFSRSGRFEAIDILTPKVFGG